MSKAPIPDPGDSLASVETPALVVDLDALERNIAGMADFARGRGLRLRPHAKTHKSIELARLQMAAGAVGLCVQKLSEAQVLAEGGVTDLYISNQIVDEAKLARVAALAGRVNLAIAVDSALGVDRLAAAMQPGGGRIDVFVEVDIGQGRCGVPPTEAGALAHRVLSQEAQGLRFAGLQAYQGGLQHLRGVAEREAAVRHAHSLTRAARAAVTAGGIACPLITGGGTGSFAFDADGDLYGELQAGSYVFMDRNYGAIEPAGHAPQFEAALFVKSQVISRGFAHAVIDAGHKAHALDSGPPRVWQRDLAWHNGGDEHGVLRPGRDALPALGETVWLQPGHCDPTANLHDHYVVVRGGLAQGRVVAVWPVDARGALR